MGWHRAIAARCARKLLFVSSCCPVKHKSMLQTGSHAVSFLHSGGGGGRFVQALACSLPRVFNTREHSARNVSYRWQQVQQ